MDKDTIIERFPLAIKNYDIFLYYQPQYNHISGRLIGAEALMRWEDSEEGLQYPADFIPILEETGLIYEADLHVFEMICIFLDKCIKNNIQTVPISFNVSRYDLKHDDYVDEIEKIREGYGIPVSLLRAEITESSAVGGMTMVSRAIDKLHDKGYLVEMDDFGSGYSSLNVLKDLPVDVIKLDMRFLSGNIGGRGGTILNAVAQMSKWLNTPVIAEGVETMMQANYMSNIGCYYIQGYLYSKPVSETDFITMLQTTSAERDISLFDSDSMIDTYQFYDPNSKETEYFNRYSGPSMIFTYVNGDINILRINAKYADELGININVYDIYTISPWDLFGQHNKETLEDVIRKAKSSKKEEIYESWIELESECCGKSRIFLINYLSYMGTLQEQDVIFLTIRNISKERDLYEKTKESEEKFRFASEHTGTYAWEYDIDTKEMRPCSRCMRDLNLPSVVKDYPKAVFENGLFPMEYEKTYNEWLDKLRNGAKSIEGIIPLTSDRIPFRIRYTTQFDEAGRPLKAYGSATPVEKSSLIPQDVVSDMIFAFAREHKCIYEVNLNTNHFVAVRTSANGERNTNEIKEGNDFFEYIINETGRTVTDKKDFMLNLSRDRIVADLECDGVFTYKYKIELAGVTRAIYVKAVYADEIRNRILLVVDETEENIKKHLKDSMNENLMIHSQMAKALAQDYIHLYCVNIETDDFIEFVKGTDGSLVTKRNGRDFFSVSRKDALFYIHKDDIKNFLSGFTKSNIMSIVRNGRSFISTYRLLIGSRYFFVNMKISIMDDAHIIVGVNNVDEQVKQKARLKKIEDERLSYSRFFALSEDFICIYAVDPETDDYKEYNAVEMYQNLGIAKEGKNFFESSRDGSLRVVYQDDIGRMLSFMYKESIMAEIEKNKSASIEYRLLINGEPKWVRLKATSTVEDGKPLLLFGVIDIHFHVQEKQHYDRVLTDAMNRANLDALTGVKNKRAYIDMEDILNHEMARSAMVHFAIVLFDVNGLKVINDTKGHQAGDIYLKESCSVICTIFKHSPVYRIGGDEFVAILQGRDYVNRENLIKELKDYNAKNIHTNKPVIACGLAVSSKDERYVSDVFNKADKRMYENKENLKAL